MEYAQEHTYLGTELKYLLQIEADNFSMDEDNFEVDIYCGIKSIHFNKSDMDPGEDGWYVTIDTKDLCIGKIFAKVTAYVPDSDFPDGLRKEVEKIELIPIRA